MWVLMAPRCLHVKGCVHTDVLLIGDTELEGSFVVSDGLVVDAIVHEARLDSFKNVFLRMQEKE